jgi:hypothetical protein
MEGTGSALGGFKNAKDAKDAKNATLWELAFLPSRLGRAAPGAALACRDASEFLETLRNLLKLVET